MSYLIDDLKARPIKPRFHGNGFIQLQLDDENWLDVWSPELPPFPNHNAYIHDHVWDLSSRVVLGTVTTRAWGWVPNAGNPSHTVWWVSPDGTFTKNRFGGRLELEGEYHLSEGSTYFLPKRTLHESPRNGALSATILTRIRQGIDANEPRVITPYDEQPSDAHNPVLQPPQDVMWFEIQKALFTMKPGYRGMITLLALPEKSEK